MKGNNTKIKVNKLNNLQKPLSSKSTTWVKNHINDPFVRKAKKDGFISRAAYKLIEIQQKYNIFQGGDMIVELGSAPGGWSQVLINYLGVRGKIIAIDLLEMQFKHQQIQFVQGDFTENKNILKFSNEDANFGVDSVISDMAPNCSGDNVVDHWRIMSLAQEAFEFALVNLKKNGHFIVKIFIGGDEKEFLAQLKPCFKSVNLFKPKSSRQESSEVYIVAKGFKSS